MDPRLKPNTLQKTGTGPFWRRCSNELLTWPLPTSHPLATPGTPKLFFQEQRVQHNSLQLHSPKPRSFSRGPCSPIYKKKRAVGSKIKHYIILRHSNDCVRKPYLQAHSSSYNLNRYEAVHRQPEIPSLPRSRFEVKFISIQFKPMQRQFESNRSMAVTFKKRGNFLRIARSGPENSRCEGKTRVRVSCPQRTCR